MADGVTAADGIAAIDVADIEHTVDGDGAEVQVAEPMGDTWQSIQLNRISKIVIRSQRTCEMKKKKNVEFIHLE